MRYENRERQLSDEREQEQAKIEILGDTAESQPDQSNIIQGPWSKAEEGSDLPEHEAVPGDISSNEEGESTPETQGADIVSHEQFLRRKEELQAKRDELARAYEQQEVAEALESPEDQKETSGGKSEYGSEVSHEYQRCQRCKGTGRRWLIFTCPECGGIGQILTKSSFKSSFKKTASK